MTGTRVTRRTFLKGCTATACALATAQRMLPAQQANPYAPLRMGVQSYCFRKFSFHDALAKTHELGLGFIEVFPGHFKSNLPPGDVEKRRAGLDDLGIKMNAYGVCGFGKNHEKNRRLFEFAKAVGIESLSANPTKDSFDSLQTLVQEFEITIAIHNHGPKSRYSTDKDILDLVDGRSERIGVCIDTGHFMRSDVDPVAVVRTFGPRVHGVHLKDTKDKRDVIVGRGDLDLPAFLRALKDIGFAGFFSLEYESDPENPIPAMQECLSAVRQALAKLT